MYFPFVITEICCAFMNPLSDFLFLKKRRAVTGWNSVLFQVVDILNTSTDMAEVIRDYNMVRIRIFAML